MHLSEGSMQGGPAPSRATPPRRFGPRDLARFMRARLPGTARRNVSLFLGSVAGTAVFVAVGTLVNEDLVHLLAFASIMGIGASFGALTISVKDGFAAALMEAWAGWWLGYFVSVLVKAATTPDLGLLGWGGAVLFAIIGGFVSGFIVGIVAGAAGAAGAKVKLLVRGTRALRQTAS